MKRNHHDQCQKIWGTTVPLVQNQRNELHRIEVNANGYCSKHKHEQKWNHFYVEEGELVILIWGEELKQEILIAGESLSVPPGVFHQFWAVQQTRAFELYWIDGEGTIGEDIVRESIGGIATWK